MYLLEKRCICWRRNVSVKQYKPGEESETALHAGKRSLFDGSTPLPVPEESMGAEK